MNSVKKHYIKCIILYVVLQVIIKLLLAGRIEIHLSGIVAAIASLMAAYLPLHDFFKSKNYRANAHKLFIGVGTLFYSLMKIAWIYNELITKINRSSIETSITFYLARNIMIMAAGLIILLKYAGKWNELRAIVDIFVFGVFAAYISWTCFIKFYIVNFSLGGIETVFYIAYIITDVLIMFEYLMLYMYENGYFKSLAKKTELAGFILLVMVDLWSWYGVTYSYIPDMLDKLWPVSMLMISIGMMEDNINIEGREEHRLFSIAVLSAMILATVCFIAVRLNTSRPVSVLFVGIIVFRIIVIKYIRAYEINEELVGKYIEVNDTLKSKMYEVSKIFCDLEDKVRLRTQELKEKNLELLYLSNIDFLTGLPNRRNFVESLENLINKNKSGTKFAIMFIDIDRFKSINDWYGHDIGDYILVETSKRLLRNLDKGDLVARLGGDEFVVIIDKIRTEEYVMNIAQRMVLDFRKPFVFKDKSIFTTISVGTAIYPLNAVERSSLMKCADIALYRSKDEGKNMVSMYDWSMKNRENRRLEIENRLCQALENDEFYLCYQPQFELSTGKILGIEVLVRWKSAGLGDIEPKEFLEISEENGMIVNIGKKVIEESMIAIKNLNSQYDMDLRIAINISPRQFIEPDFVNNIKEAIFQYGVKSSWVELEVTEELTMTNEELVLARLLEISNMGVRIVIDNFGRGYSSFLYLKRFPINTIKIAMELVKGIGDRVEDYKIVKSIISMCREMELDVMAEGVENQIQKNILQNIGCDSVQGYFSGGLMTIEEIETKYCMDNKARKKEEDCKYENI
ncbi:MAG: EAL domain-containing protein [Proteocatella sp.]